MPKSTGPEEVQVLRFFEESPIEKAELLFNIVAVKIRERLERQKPDITAGAPPKIRTPKKRRQGQEGSNPGIQEEPQTEQPSQQL
ncbi:MAG TPA: hypothetical protein VE422_30790 [Terriglobia bacterium]|nr:hypothetical protein [Terriglobia bacterium]